MLAATCTRERRTGNVVAVAKWGEVARDRLRELGLRDLGEAQAEHRRLLELLGARSRLAFAASVAERLLRRHEDLPEEQQRPFSLTWRPVIDALWLDLTGAEDAFVTVSHALGRFYLSPFQHNDGPDGPSDADEDEAAAAIYTAECLMHGCVDTAVCAGSRGVDAAFEQAAIATPRDDAHGLDGFVAQIAHPVAQAELSRQTEDLEFLVSEGAALEHGDSAAGTRIVRFLQRP